MNPTLTEVQALLGRPLGDLKPFEIRGLISFLESRSWDHGNPAFGQQQTVSEIVAGFGN